MTDKTEDGFHVKGVVREKILFSTRPTPLRREMQPPAEKRKNMFWNYLPHKYHLSLGINLA